MQDIRDLHSKLFEMLSDFDNFCKKHSIQYCLAYGSVLGAIRHGDFIPWDDDLDVMMTRENYDKLLSVFENDRKYFLQKDGIDYPLHFSKLRCNETTFIENIEYRKKYKNIHQGIFIDIFPIDKVSLSRISSFFQFVFSKILITQSLTLRGYQTSSIAKKIFMFFSFFLLPLRNRMKNFIVKYNSDSCFDNYCSYFGDTKKIYLEKKFLENFEYVKFRDKIFPVPVNYEDYLVVNYNNWKNLPSEEERIAKIHAKYFSTTEDYTKYLEKK